MATELPLEKESPGHIRWDSFNVFEEGQQLNYFKILLEQTDKYNLYLHMDAPYREEIIKVLKVSIQEIIHEERSGVVEDKFEGVL